jgi:phosphatidylserine/phosphatidylglycerophosphate/cardiolipin synthase-like enzyme/uncharacterized membrane protein YdjX (TVP38/TMEM64 family)
MRFPSTSPPRGLVREGATCWKQAHARRVAFLVDGASFFEAFAAAAERARRSILIVAWDIDSRVRLWNHARRPGVPPELGRFLRALLRRRPALEVHVLNWDFAAIYAFERETLSLSPSAWRLHRRLHYAWDGENPIGASQHQKIVVIDDDVAFLGGLDLTGHRWDTPAHRARHPHRRTPGGRTYGPFHDVQVAVQGEAAAALGALARERWRRATDGRIQEPPRERGHDAWPPELAPDLEDVDVCLSRTEPKHDGRPEVREVERLFLESIEAARRELYIENQYLTSYRVGEALARRLAAPDAPEVVIVGPRECSGWLEELTMGVLRTRLIRRLEAADRHRKLRIYHPVAPGPPEACVNVHSKVMVVDDRLVRIGSANLSNRSMALDTECDLAIEAHGERRVRGAIMRFRNRLLAEHLRTEPGRLEAAIGREGSLIAALDTLTGPDRPLRPLELPETLDKLIPESELLDPERPPLPAVLFEHFAGSRDRGTVPLVRVLFLIAAIVAVLVLARVSGWFRVERLLDWAGDIDRLGVAPLLVAGIYTIGVLLFVPLSLINQNTALVFGGFPGILYILLGELTACAVTYGLGRALPRAWIDRVSGAPVERIGRILGAKGALAVAALRMVPVAPTAVVNAVCGAVRVRFRPFLLGSLLGFLPGALAMSALGHQLAQVLRHPTPGRVLLLVVILAAIAGAMLYLRLRVRGRARARSGTAAPGGGGGA